MIISVHLRSCNGQYLCADMGQGGCFFANRKHAKGWETFTLNECHGKTSIYTAGALFVGSCGGFVCFLICFFYLLFCFCLSFIRLCFETFLFFVYFKLRHHVVS
jgi:hypothetical protein